MADKAAPVNPPRVSEEVKLLMEEKLAEERVWNATQLAEALEGRFGTEPRVGAETIRQHLLTMGSRGSAPATCPPNRQTTKRSVKPEKSCGR